MRVKRIWGWVICMAAMAVPAAPVSAQFNWGRALQAVFEGAQALSLSDDQMAAYVHQSVVQMDSRNKKLPDSSPYVQRLKKLTSKVTDADGIPLDFGVYQTKEVNAFACPDGSVRVYTGLMDLMSDDELMGVIGHEIGHVEKHHSKKQLKSQLLTGALRDAIGSAGGAVAVLTDSQLASIGQTLMSAQYSQKQEKEADDCGYDFLVRNGMNPWGMVTAFQKLDSTGASETGGLQKMFSSHPDTQERIRRMSERALKDGYPIPATLKISTTK